MRADETLYYLELRSLAQRAASASSGPGGLKLVAQPDPDVIHDATLAIGQPYDWPSQHWSHAQWAAYLGRGDLRHQTATSGNERADLATLRFDDEEVELDTVGPLPQHLGKGLGGVFLTLVTQLAWDEAPTAQRRWLHTSSEDHPNALQNYERRGFSLLGTDAQGDQ
ncbi:MAG: N-acetyltransferase [Mycobacteriales bacterium]